jgi:exonuclease III
MAAERQFEGWKVFWCMNCTGAGTSSGHGSAGVMIMVRKRLLESGALKIDEGSIQPAATVSTDGRLLSVNAEWGGHKLQLASVYMPNEAAAQRRFIDERLVPLCAAAGSRVPVWGGDFNFVANPSLERLRKGPNEQGLQVLRPAEGTTTPVGQAWAQALPALCDVWRSRHPVARMVTHFGPHGAARLDRFYVGTAAVDYARCPYDVLRPRLEGGGYLSDHCPVVLRLAPCTPPERARAAPRRLRLWFTSDADLCQQFAAWAAERLQSMPTDHRDVLKWFLRLQRRILWKGLQLNQLQRQKQQQREQLPNAALEALYDTVVGADPGAALAATEQIVAARQAVAEAAAATEAAMQVKQRRHWVHCGERPNAALTGQLRPAAAAGVATLHAPNGAVAATPAACARLCTAHWAGVCRQPTTTQAAQQEVLAALGQPPALDPAAVQALGGTAVTEQEVRKALRHSKPGTAPGGDGIPVQLYQRFKAQFAPILARLYTAIGTLGRVPRGFLDSIITVLYKKGDRTDPGNYRPISLTHTAYRLLGKVLGGRLAGVLPQLIDPAQTAFVPGRSIGENVLLLQLLPKLLEQQGRTALMAFCDFRKAYDTIDREFLLAVMERLGVGAGMLRWVRLLHTATRSAALVHGCLASPRTFHAGVRQGCPLAPLLYLFVGQALLCLLRARGIGVQVDGKLLSGMQYADDMKAVLDGAQQVEPFLAAMATFAAASGQHLEPSKTQLLPIGKHTTALPAEVGGLAVKTSASALGLKFKAFTGEVEADWAALVTKVEERQTKLARCGLSMFGRAFASNAYAASSLLYHAEFAGLPPDDVVKRLEQTTAKLVVRGEAPAATGRGFSGVSAFNMVGRPQDGGLGVLPLREHVAARHAKWALRLATSDSDSASPWIQVARLVLRAAFQDEFGAGATPLLLLTPSRPASSNGLPPVLRRMLLGVQALPQLEVVAEGGLQPGAWCLDAPLWGNPVLRCALGALERHPSVGLLAAARVGTVGRALRARHLVHQWATRDFHREAIALFGYEGRHVLGERHEVLAQLDELATSVLPTAWVQQCQQARPAEQAVPQAGEAERALQAAGHIAARLGWRHGESATALPDYSVRLGTALQLLHRQPQPQLRDGQEVLPSTALQLLAAFAQEAGPGQTVAAVQQMLRRVWALRWDNKKKEVLWLLALNGLPTAARLHKPTQRCGCDEAVGAGRGHVYADCRAASHVRAAVAGQLTGEWSLGAGHLQRQHVWLAQRPVPTLHQGVWDVVCLAALNAMDSARVLMWERQRQNQGQPGEALADAAGRQAVARFWALLADFCGLGMAPRRWRDRVPSGHPFLHWVPAENKWRVNRR